MEFSLLFPRERIQGYRNAAISFKGSDKPERPRGGPVIFFFVVQKIAVDILHSLTV